MNQNWGKSAAINLFDCNFEKVSNPEVIKNFFPEIIRVISMKAHGPVYIDRFGEGELEGWSAMQFIETSSITVHADEVSKRCFVDIFSCRDFDEKIAENFAKEYFGAIESSMTVCLR